jgi:hypothetical protein
VKISSSNLWDYKPDQRERKSLEINRFDRVIEKACLVCSERHKDRTYKMGEEGWFEVLEFLQEYRLKSAYLVDKIPTDQFN